jgi:predicted transcriptional regulator
MPNFRTLSGTIFILTLLVSCGGGRTESDKIPKQEIPKALQDNKLEIKSYSRTGDLTEELYQELVDKTPALKKLEDDLDAFIPKPGDLNEKFQQYDSKSNSYYSSANYKASAITDSLLRVKIIELITASNKKYSTKTAELNSLLKQISKTGASLNDHHSVLKIVLTLPLIEKYQGDNNPNKKEFKDLIKQQENLILQTDSLTPKY